MPNLRIILITRMTNSIKLKKLKQEKSSLSKTHSISSSESEIAETEDSAVIQLVPNNNNNMINNNNKMINNNNNKINNNNKSSSNSSNNNSKSKLDSIKKITITNMSMKIKSENMTID